MKTINKISAVFYKDLFSEFRTRYAISAIFLFILTTVTMIIFSTSGEKLSNGLLSGILWIVMFFGAMTGMQKSMVSEEERGTSLYLKLSTTSGATYFGKLLFNILLSLSMNTFAVLLFLMMMGNFQIKNYSIFIITVILGSFGLASATTIISAIIARANTKGALFPVLAFPILLPLIVLGIELIAQSFDGAKFSDALGNIQLILAYCGIIVPVSYILFDVVWEE